MNLYLYGQLIYDKEGKNIQWGKTVSAMWCWENWTATCKRMKLEHFLTLYLKINSKWIKDINVKPETIKHLEENIGSKLLNISLGNDFFGYDTKGKGNKSKNKQVRLHQTKNFCTAKETINKMKR